MQFKLLRYFSIASAVAILALATALFSFYGRSAETQLVATVGRDNIVLATAMANDIVESFPEHFLVPHTPGSVLNDHHRRMILDIDRKLRRLVAGSPILAVNVFWNDVTVYSSRKELIGTIKKSPSFLTVRTGGEAISKLVFKGTFNAFVGEVTDRNILETYVSVRLPERLAQSDATLILEIYTDVSVLAGEIKSTKQRLLVGLVLGFGALYLMLYLIARHADTIISRHDKRFTDFAEVASDWFWEMDENLRFTYFSPRNEYVTGFNLNALIDKTRAEGSSEKTDDHKWRTHNTDLEARRPFKDFQYKLAKPNGDIRHVSINGKPIFDDTGNFTGYRGTGSDITKRTWTEEQNRRLAASIDAISAVVALYDSDDRLVICNARFRELNTAVPETFEPGFTFEEYLRATVTKGLVPAAVGHEEEWISDRMERRKNPSGPFELLRQDGQWMLVHEERLEDGSTILFSIDIRELKQAHEDRQKALSEAEQANQAKSAFLATMSHELRTPLNAILGFSDILSHQYFGPPGAGKYREYANDIHTSGEHLLELVNDLLDISSIEAGKQNLNKERLAVDEMVAESFNALGQKAKDKGIKLITKVAENLLPLYADRRATRQILLNLLSNAVKFTPEGGKITVSAMTSKHNTTFTIADTGPGIPAEKLPHLTDPFVRGEQDPHKSVDGWGLGLSITKSLVDLHDGTMDIASKVGKGTTVTVTLPNGAP